MISALVKRVPADGFCVSREIVRVRTGTRLEFVDLTDRVEACVRRAGVVEGIVSVQTLHTTAGILVNENEPLLLDDLADLFERFAPRGAFYRHDDLGKRAVGLPPDERRNGDAHARACLLRASETLHLGEGRLRLGPWQRIFLVELDGARDRSVSILVMGLGA